MIHFRQRGKAARILAKRLLAQSVGPLALCVALGAPLTVQARQTTSSIVGQELR
jgi:hypothetical protein